MKKNLPERSVSIAKAFIAALEQKDLTVLASKLSETASLEIPLAPTGHPSPWYLFKGKNAIIGYLQGACEMLSQLHWVNPVYTGSSDGKRVFLEAHGDLIKADGNVPYENAYVYRFDFDGEKIIYIAEYANPVTFSKLMNLPVG